MNVVVDFKKSDLSMELLKQAMEKTSGSDGTVHLVTSLPPMPRPSLQKIEDSKVALEEAKEIVAQEGIPCETHLLVNNQSEGKDIVRFAREHDAGLIIISAEKQSPIGKFFRGSTIRHVEKHAECPVLKVSEEQGASVR